MVCSIYNQHVLKIANDKEIPFQRSLANPGDKRLIVKTVKEVPHPFKQNI